MTTNHQSITLNLGEASNATFAHLHNLRVVNNEKTEQWYSSNEKGICYPRAIVIDYQQNIHPLPLASTPAVIDPLSSWSNSVSTINQASSRNSHNHGKQL